MGDGDLSDLRYEEQRDRKLEEEYESMIYDIWQDDDETGVLDLHLGALRDNLTVKNADDALRARLNLQVDFNGERYRLVRHYPLTEAIPLEPSVSVRIGDVWADPHKIKKLTLHQYVMHEFIAGRAPFVGLFGQEHESLGYEVSVAPFSPFIAFRALYTMQVRGIYGRTLRKVEYKLGERMEDICVLFPFDSTYQTGITSLSAGDTITIPLDDKAPVAKFVKVEGKGGFHGLESTETD